MRIVELFGPPGVGKTTLARHVTHRPRGLPSSSGIPSGPYAPAFAVLRTHVTPRLEPRLVFSGRLLAGLERIVAHPATGAWLLEEGCAQRCNVLALIAVPVETQQAYLNALPVDHLTICLCVADAETIVTRGQHRGRAGLPPEHGPISLAACRWIADVLEARGADVRRFDMLQPVAANAARLREVLALAA